MAVQEVSNYRGDGRFPYRILGHENQGLFLLSFLFFSFLFFILVLVLYFFLVLVFLFFDFKIKKNLSPLFCDCF